MANEVNRFRSTLNKNMQNISNNQTKQTDNTEQKKITDRSVVPSSESNSIRKNYLATDTNTVETPKTEHRMQQVLGPIQWDLSAGKFAFNPEPKKNAESSSVWESIYNNIFGTFGYKSDENGNLQTFTPTEEETQKYIENNNLNSEGESSLPNRNSPLWWQAISNTNDALGQYEEPTGKENLSPGDIIDVWDASGDNWANIYQDQLKKLQQEEENKYNNVDKTALSEALSVNEYNKLKGENPYNANAYVFDPKTESYVLSDNTPTESTAELYDSTPEEANIGTEEQAEQMSENVTEEVADAESNVGTNAAFSNIDDTTDDMSDSDAVLAAAGGTEAYFMGNQENFGFDTTYDSVFDFQLNGSAEDWHKWVNDDAVRDLYAEEIVGETYDGGEIPFDIFVDWYDYNEVNNNIYTATMDMDADAYYRMFGGDTNLASQALAYMDGYLGDNGIAGMYGIPSYEGATEENVKALYDNIAADMFLSLVGNKEGIDTWEDLYTLNELNDLMRYSGYEYGTGDGFDMNYTLADYDVNNPYTYDQLIASGTMPIDEYGNYTSAMYNQLDEVLGPDGLPLVFWGEPDYTMYQTGLGKKAIR